MPLKLWVNTMLPLLGHGAFFLLGSKTCQTEAKEREIISDFLLLQQLLPGPRGRNITKLICKRGEKEEEKVHLHWEHATVITDQKFCLG